jgi:hypothetical protein
MFSYWVLVANIVTCIPVDTKTNYGTGTLNSLGSTLNNINNNLSNIRNSLNNGGDGTSVRQQYNQNVGQIGGGSGYATAPQQDDQTPPKQEIGMGWKAWNAEGLKT